jgi:lactoylglutathione lyase
MEDLAKGVRFYRDVLGLRLRWESDDVAVFDTGTATLMLESAHDHAGKEDPGTGRFLGVTLEAPDLARTYRALSERGVEFLHPPQAQTWGGVMTHFRDPSGNVVTAVQFVASRRA